MNSEGDLLFILLKIRAHKIKFYIPGPVVTIYWEGATQV